MKLILSLHIIFIFLNSSTCSSDQHFKEIKFGSGGGFTGATTTYRIKENGDVFQSDSMEKGEQLIKSITAEELQIIREKVAQLSKETLTINHPYNVYRFIEIDTMRAVWGDPAYTVPKELEDLYRYLELTAIKH